LLIMLCQDHDPRWLGYLCDPVFNIAGSVGHTRTITV
jgi:hypothetical protein